MGFFDEFRKFIRRGNVVDLAVGVIIGAAFGKLVNSLVDDILMPPIAALVGEVDFSSLSLRLTDGTHPVMIRYGAFLQNVIQFFIIAVCVFLVIKGFNSLQEAAERRGLLAPDQPPPPDATPTEKLLAEIRDELRKQRGGPDGRP